MEVLAKKKFNAYVKIPQEFRSLLEKKETRAILSLDPKTLNFSITVCPKNDSTNKKFVGSFSKTEDIYYFSAIPSKKCRFIGGITYRSSLFLDNPKIDDFPKISSKDENKPEILLDEAQNIIKTPGAFKLHPNHKILTCLNEENAAWNIIKKEYGVHRTRENRSQIIKKLKIMFKNQKYWRIKDLADETSQPENYIREIMRSVGRKIKFGEYRGLWELFPNKN